MPQLDPDLSPEAELDPESMLDDELVLAAPVRSSFFADLAAVGAVEAAALEHHPDGVEKLAQPTGALLACGQGIVGEGLDHIEAVAALGAGIAVSGHTNLRDGLNV